MSRNVFHDIGHHLKSKVGGELKNLSKLGQEMRRDLVRNTMISHGKSPQLKSDLLQMHQAEDECISMGANAIVGMRIETNSAFEGSVDMVLYGTAVWAKRD